MCGIVGQISIKKDSIIRKKDITVMLHTLLHRGNEDTDFFMSKDQHYCVGFTRLGLIDILQGKQPMMSFNNAAVIACNGEIYTLAEVLKLRYFLKRLLIISSTRITTLLKRYSTPNTHIDCCMLCK